MDTRDIDTSRFPNVGNSKFYNKNEFCVGAMLPQVGSTKGLETPFSDRSITEIIDKNNKEFDSGIHFVSEASEYDNFITETKDKTELDNNYKSKGEKKLSDFERISIRDSRIHDKVINKSLSKEIEKILKYKGDGYVYFDDTKIVGYILVCKKFICPIHVNEKYRGYDLSKQILHDAMNDFDAKYLWCATDNEIALKLYKSQGFKIDKKESDENYYKMTLESVINDNLFGDIVY